MHSELHDWCYKRLTSCETKLLLLIEGLKLLNLKLVNWRESQSHNILNNLSFSFGQFQAITVELWLSAGNLLKITRKWLILMELRKVFTGLWYGFIRRLSNMNRPVNASSSTNIFTNVYENFSSAGCVQTDFVGMCTCALLNRRQRFNNESIVRLQRSRRELSFTH